MDHAFASMLKGQDITSGESLPGFDNGRRSGMSRTDMVRCKSLVEATRVQIVEVMSKEAEPELESESQADDGNETGMETDGGMSIDMRSTWDDEDESHNMDVARVYAETIVQLGDLLDNETTFDPVAN